MPSRRSSTCICEPLAGLGLQPAGRTSSPRCLHPGRSGQERTPMSNRHAAGRATAPKAARHARVGQEIRGDAIFVGLYRYAPPGAWNERLPRALFVLPRPSRRRCSSGRSDAVPVPPVCSVRGVRLPGNRQPLRVPHHGSPHTQGSRRHGWPARTPTIRNRRQDGPGRS